MGDFGLGGGQVVVLADVVAQVVQFQAVVLEEVDELPVSRPHAAAGRAALVAVVGVVPEDPLAVERPLTPQQPGNAEPVGVLIGHGGQAGHLQDRRVEVRARDRHGANAVRGRHARPANEQRLARAAFVHPALALGQWGVAGGAALAGGEAAVVGREEEDRIVGNAFFLERGQQAADVFVEVLHHARVGRVGLELPARHGDVLLVLDGMHLAGLKRVELVQPERGRLGLVFLNVVLGRLDRRVEGIVGQMQEEGALRVATLDQGDRLIRQPVGQVLPFGAVFEIFHAVRREVAFARAAPLESADVDVEAVLVRPVGPAAEVPLADVPGLVAAALQRGGQGGLFQRQVVDVGRVDQAAAAGMEVPAPGDPVGHADVGGVLAGEDARPGRAADGAGGIGVGEPHAALGQAVEVGRLVEAAPLAAEVPPAHIIDENEDNVGPRHAGTPVWGQR